MTMPQHNADPANGEGFRPIRANIRQQLANLTTRELRIRAESLGIKDSEEMDHSALVDALIDYRRHMTDSSSTFH